MKMLNYPQKTLVLVQCSQQKPSGPRPQRTLADQGRVDAYSRRCERIREQFAPRAAVIPTFTNCVWQFNPSIFFAISLQCEAPKIAKLVLCPITMVYGVADINIVTGVYKPTYNWGPPHCRNIYFQHFSI